MPLASICSLYYIPHIKLLKKKKKDCCCLVNSTFNTQRRKRDVSLFMEEDLHQILLQGTFLLVYATGSRD